MQSKRLSHYFITHIDMKKFCRIEIFKMTIFYEGILTPIWNFIVRELRYIEIICGIVYVLKSVLQAQILPQNMPILAKFALNQFLKYP